jgi:hypothetical protein
MSTPSAGPDIDEPDEFAEFDEFPDGTDNFDEVVRSLAYGSRQWIRRHAGYLDSPAGRAELPLTPRVKALLQLALLCRLWAKTFPQDPALAETIAVVEHAYQSPGFPHVATLDPRYSRPLLLMYCALSPPGAPAETRRTVLDRLRADGFLAVRPESPYLHLETRFFADMAGVEHGLAPRPELYAASVLAQADASAVSGLDSCNITHTVLYLSEFGLRDPGLTEPQREHAARVLLPLTDHRVQCGDWDAIGKLLLAQRSLGLDPLHTASGRAGLRLLARIRRPDGAIPGKSAAEHATAQDTPERFFRLSYQTTLVTLMSMLVLTALRPAQAEPAPMLQEVR